MSTTTTTAAPELTPGEQAILRKLGRGREVSSRYGRSGWVYEQLPKGAKGADAAALEKRGLITFIGGSAKLTEKGLQALGNEPKQ